MIKSGIQIAELDVEANPIFGERFSADGTPTLKLFPKGEKKDDKIEEYEESRSLEKLVEWIKK